MRLSIQNFKHWLLKHEASDCVGATRSPGRCPIATYLSDRTGQSWRVGHDSYLPLLPGGVAGPRRELPDKLARFVYRLDRIYGLSPFTVTAAQALAVLLWHPRREE
jgi:hypothetical protein